MTGRTAAALLALSAAACIPRAPTPGPDDGAWGRARAENTRSVKLYDGLAMRAFATATWESPEVRAARTDRIAAWKAMTAQERSSLKATEEAEAARYDEFTVSMVTSDRSDNDLDANRSTWRIALVQEGAPDVVAERPRSLTADPLLRTLYPQIGDFDTVYRVRFPRLDGPPRGAVPFTLRIAGPRGRMDFPFGPGTSPDGRPAPPGPTESPTSSAR